MTAAAKTQKKLSPAAGAAAVIVAMGAEEASEVYKHPAGG